MTKKSAKKMAIDEIITTIPDEEIVVQFSGLTLADINLAQPKLRRSESQSATNNIFTINDISDGSSTDDSLSIAELKRELENSQKTIAALESKIQSFMNGDIVMTDDRVVKLAMKLVDGGVLAEKTDIACWWCAHQFDTPPVCIPKEVINGVYYVFGCFCSYDCAGAYNLEMGDYHVFSRHSMLTKMKNDTYNDETPIIIAPPRESLKMFGGYMTIKQFRAASTFNRKEYRMIMPPMMSIVPMVGEYGGKHINKSTKLADGGLVWKRTKKLPNVGENLINQLKIKVRS